MRPPDETKAELVDAWLAKADEDLAVADYLASGRTPYLTAIGFHAQQAVEKYIKAFLVWHQVEFPKTHDLDRLRHLAAAVDAGLASTLLAASVLTDYAADLRYPGEVPEPTAQEAVAAVELARRVRDAVRGRLPVSD